MRFETVHYFPFSLLFRATIPIFCARYEHCNAQQLDVYTSLPVFCTPHTLTSLFHDVTHYIIDSNICSWNFVTYVTLSCHFRTATTTNYCLMVWLHDPVSCIQYEASSCRAWFSWNLQEMFPVTMHGLSLPVYWIQDTGSCSHTIIHVCYSALALYIAHARNDLKQPQKVTRKFQACVLNSRRKETSSFSPLINGNVQ